MLFPHLIFCLLLSIVERNKLIEAINLLSYAIKCGGQLHETQFF